jgi:hypothetical protein
MFSNARCDVCQEDFNSNSDLKRHIKQKRDIAHRNFLKQELDLRTADAPSASSSTASDNRPHVVNSDYLDPPDDDTLPDPEIIEVDPAENDPVALRVAEMMKFYQVPDGDQEQLFSFVPPPGDEDMPDIGEEGPGPATLHFRRHGRVLDEEQDQMFVEQFVGAGVVIRMSETIRDKWKAFFQASEDDLLEEDSGLSYKPFASALDWKIAHWAITQKVSQTAMNKLLAIPEASASYLVGYLQE